MSGFDLNVLNLNGDYVVDPRSESLEEGMNLQGIGWATRKIGAKFANSMGLNLVYDADKFVQTYSAAVKYVNYLPASQIKLTNEKEQKLFMLI